MKKTRQKIVRNAKLWPTIKWKHITACANLLVLNYSTAIRTTVVRPLSKISCYLRPVLQPANLECHFGGGGEGTDRTHIEQQSPYSITQQTHTSHSPDKILASNHHEGPVYFLTTPSSKNVCFYSTSKGLCRSCVTYLQMTHTHTYTHTHLNYFHGIVYVKTHNFRTKALLASTGMSQALRNLLCLDFFQFTNLMHISFII